MARVRFAPSPTGMLHLGGARTALFNYLYAKATGGSFVLRIEDTDKERLVPGSINGLQESLEWLGLHFDESPSLGGDYGPYIQSERLSLYQQFAQNLVKSGNAYPCFCSQERLQTLQKMGYDGQCRRLSKKQVEKKLQTGSPHTIRLMVPNTGSTMIYDRVYGQVNVAHTEINDQVLLKSDGTPTYHLASVVDDHCMDITHVLRGEEWLLSTAKHLLLYSAFQWTPPTYAHLPLLLSSSGSKLSKRNNDVFIENFKERGYQPESIINFLSLLGWGPSQHVSLPNEVQFRKHSKCKEHEVSSQELMTIEELIGKFSLEGINRTQVVVNEAKLLWMNKHYFKQKLNKDEYLEELAKQLRTEICRHYSIDGEDELVNLDHLKKILLLLEDRIPFIPKVVTEAKYFWTDPTIHADLFSVVKLDDKAQCLTVIKDTLETCDFDDTDVLNATLKDIALKLSVPFKQLMLLLRIALTGVKASPGLPAMMKIVGGRTILSRLNNAIRIIT